MITKDRTLKDFSEGCVDVLLRAGDSCFRATCHETQEEVDMAANQSLPSVFTGVLLSRRSESYLMQNKRHYLCKRKYLPKDCSPSRSSDRQGCDWPGYQILGRTPLLRSLGSSRYQKKFSRRTTVSWSVSLGCKMRCRKLHLLINTHARPQICKGHLTP